jgi:hypothetical protein
MIASAALIPTTNAHTPPWTITTVYCYTVVSPNIIGVGQTDSICFWSNEMPPTAVGTNGDRWSFSVDVTKPDGTHQTLGPITSDPVGNGYTPFTPDSVGNYTFVTTVAQHKITGGDPNGFVPNWGSSSTGYAFVNDTFVSATSAPVTLVVQADPVAQWPASPLPNNYWDRPISGENREWWTISGNWVESRGYNGASEGYYYKGGGYNPYSTGPTSAHIVWAKPMPGEFGGVMGGDVSQDGGVGSYYTGMSYEQAFAPPLILNGRLYFNTPPGAAPYYGCYCYDLRTGTQIWYQNYTISNGEIYNYISPNQYGGIPYLWSLGSTYKMYDAVTGNWILSFTNALTGTVAYSDSDGSMLVYITGGTSPNRWLAMWNSSLAIWAAMPNLYSGNNYWLWRPPTGSAALNWSLGIQWNITEPAITGSPSIQKVDKDVVLCQARFAQNDGTTIAQDVGYGAKNGALLWGPINRTAVVMDAAVLTGMSDGVYVEYIGETFSFIAYSSTNGTKLWGPTQVSPAVGAFAEYGSWRTSWVGNGKVYLPGMDGQIHCMDLYTGNWLWDFTTGSCGFEAGYSNWPLISASFFGGAPDTGGLRIYAVGGHTHLQPIFRGAQLYAVDGNNGSLLWSIDGWFQAGGPVGADGYMVGIDGYTNELTCFGKGNTETTVDTPMTGVTVGNNVVIRGTVTDQSPGQTCLGIPTAGTPAISDASMSQWMEYLYMDQPKPTNATGVPISINVIDSNGNLRPIGATSTDTSGTFAYSWKPDIAGDYTVIATFEGSESYYSSSAETHFTADDLASTPSPLPVTAQPPMEMYFALSTVAIIIAIVVVGVLLALVLKKRP